MAFLLLCDLGKIRLQPLLIVHRLLLPLHGLQLGKLVLLLKYERTIRQSSSASVSLANLLTDTTTGIESETNTETEFETEPETGTGTNID